MTQIPDPPKTTYKYDDSTVAYMINAAIAYGGHLVKLSLAEEVDPAVIETLKKKGYRITHNLGQHFIDIEW
jgi:hypothetical protein